MAAVRVRDERVAGPAAAPAGAAGVAGGIAPGSPNRLGSDEVPVRVYEPERSKADGADGAEPWATLVWAHGGSFVRGGLDWPEADWAARRFAEAGLRVYSVDYALASDEVKAPAPANDVAAVLREARARHGGPLIVGGASAGGHLAVAAALTTAEDRDRPIRPDALLLVYPTLHRVQRPDPAIAAATAALSEQRRFGAERIAQMYEFYLGGADPRQDPPLPVGELPSARLAELPPSCIVNADADDLRASAERFAEQLREAGVPVDERVQPGTVHGYLNRPEESARARRDARATIDALVAGARRAILESPPSAARKEPVIEPEILAPVSLTLPDGSLNREAVGWAAQPVVDTSGLSSGLGRNKRWEYWNIATPTHIVALTVSHIDYACVHEVWAYDRATGETRGRAATVLPARGAVLAPRLEHGRSMARTRDLAIDIDEVDGGTRLRFEIPGVSLDAVAELPEGHERLAVVVPWSDRRFQYTVKDLARPARGVLRIDGVAHEIGGAAGEAWAVLDHGRGRWPYDICWNWGAGSGRSGRAGGRVIGLQVGAKWTEGSGVSENAFFVDGRMHKIHGETVWEYDLDDWRSPWRVRGGGLDAVFEPFHDKRTRTDLLVLQGRTDQCFGVWSGSFVTADGETIEFDGLVGWAEEVHNRW